MSLVKMVSLHPQVGGNVNETLVEASRHAMLCSLFCTSCADACVVEEMDMAACIRSCLDCADVCATTARLGVRRSDQNVETLRAMLEMCILACERCAAECEKHEAEHCQLCAKMCRECADGCKQALATVGNA
ncbi:four-helix bundle copper-binding protein [Altericroceibacterium xinjiangense]|uniref:four-helix bundle copper-binding protein n=1 Tax=Altericroceibacterium xinjiangense TaxID=762261 RepID=UPI000F7E3AA4|nr:four-helix bundle copper-binding protein [Altericroceibacterium xinjiangense]